MPKVKLSPEARKELKKQQKIERKLRQEEKKLQRTRDRLEREIKYGDLSVRQNEKNWKKMLVKVALPRMREELEFAWHNFEKVVDCKDFTISLLMDELKDAEEQNMHNFRAHLDSMDKLLDMLNDRLEELRNDYDLEVEEMENRCIAEVEGIKDNTDGSQTYLKMMIFQLETKKRKQDRLKKAEYFSRMDEVEGKNQFLLQKLKAHSENKYLNTFDSIQSFVHDYHKQIKERKTEYIKLKTADDAIQELIVQQFKQIKKLNDSLRLMRQTFRDVKQTEGGNLLDLKMERQYFAHSFRSLKIQLDDDQKDDFDKLARLSECCAKIFDYLERMCKKGGMILKIAAVCRKLETEKEKISPFPKNDVGIEKQVRLTKIEDDDEASIKKEMVMFWQRAGQVYGVHYTLNRKKQFLIEENQLFIETLNDYCENLIYPKIKKYKATINRTDANTEMQKYKRFKMSKLG
ncbi:hypothetical protein BDFB_007694 [Asbolus verrucosus]|uniref:Dynein regulatory complex subunit 2 n=1 Tax=Asbolus verrucosus TaxID=1661398 RepID=A0A482W1B8_ASBVE|nr:hypothetical protein BDFB_007694 [Asbolus verrucosus]